MTERDILWENVYAEIVDVDEKTSSGASTLFPGLKRIRIEIVIGDQILFNQFMFDPRSLDTAYDPQQVFSMILDEMVENLDKTLYKEFLTTEE